MIIALPSTLWKSDDQETQDLAHKASSDNPFLLGGTYPLLEQPVTQNPAAYLDIVEHDIPSLPEQADVPFWDKEWIVPELKTLFFAQPDDRQTLNTYFVVDATLRQAMTQTFDLDHSLGVPVQCLFTGDATEELKEVAPYLIDMTLPDDALDDKDKVPNFHKDFFLQHWDKATGIIIRSTASMGQLHHQLRKFTKIQNEQGKWHFFRFWQPRAFYKIMHSFDEAALSPLHHLSDYMVMVIRGKTLQLSLTQPARQRLLDKA